MKFLEEIPYTQGVAAKIRALLEKTKVVLLTGYRGDNLFDFYDNLSNEIGHRAAMDEDLRTGWKTGAKWIEIKYDPQFPNSYRHSSTRQPLHTDGSYESKSPEVSFFFCIKAAPIGGATTFVDSDDLLPALELHSSGLFKACHDLPVRFAE